MMRRSRLTSCRSRPTVWQDTSQRPGRVYRYRIAYCIGLFREALVRGSEKSGVPIDLLLPTTGMINQVIEEEECRFQEGSLSMDEYLGEFCDGLIRFRNSHPDLVKKV